MAFGILDEMVQANCDLCHAALVPNAAYCDECGNRTRRARRLVRLSLRVELVFFGLICLMVAGFAFAGLYQQTH